MDYTDNSIVNKMGEIAVSGNVVPNIWYKQITRENGKPHLLAIAILSDIVYWYRPKEIRNPETGMTTGWEKRFAGKLLQRNYSYYERMFGESRKSIRSALETLEKLGVVKRRIESAVPTDFTVLGNVMYLELVPERLKNITYPREAGDSGEEPATEKNKERECGEGSAPPIALEGNTYYPEGNNPIAPEGNTYCPEGNNPIAPEGNTYCPEGNNPIAPEGMTYTENTVENTTEISVNPSIYPSTAASNSDDSAIELKSLIARNIKLEEFYKIANSERESDMLREIYDTICDVVIYPRTALTIQGVKYPWENVKQQFLKLKPVHISNILERLLDKELQIKNMRAYLVSALYVESQSGRLQEQSELHDDYLRFLRGSPYRLIQ